MMHEISPVPGGGVAPLAPITPPQSCTIDLLASATRHRHRSNRLCCVIYLPVREERSHRIETTPGRRRLIIGKSGKFLLFRSQKLAPMAPRRRAQ